ncbi:Helicase associated domain protein [Umezawaea sp. Da 62-37]|uniref:DEAD/DEAH box helicase n=1 Tax=Umezawaea sp. Da 62-37 TaxID=3075927 RepID=UPI0028F6FF20|nr:Helicase associated domain protein [Umezawaea sp. Da 62-37]WNV84971.1 Helicase associated domain protein [Umezawaea sp. Da 62-37]
MVTKTTAPNPAAQRTTRSDETIEAVNPLLAVDSITNGSWQKLADRYYQVDAVHDICSGLRDGGRGQLWSACGTGKTVMCQRAAELLCPAGGVVVVVCPSVLLVGQTLREWSSNSTEHIALAVCGDETVVDGASDLADLPAEVTTDPEAVSRWLRSPAPAGTRKLIVGTHRSAHVIGEGLLLAGLAAELLVVDEAHRSAGLVDKHTALVHNDSRLPAKRRLYATGTPRLISEAAKRNRKRPLDEFMIGMDDERTFGKVLYSYSFAQAIEDGYLDDYRLVVMGVTRKELHEHLAVLPRSAITLQSTTGLHTLMVQTVLAKAARQYGLRRCLVFCNRLNEARAFSRSMARTLSGLPASMKPDRMLTATHVHGEMDNTERERHLSLLADPPGDGWTAVTNVHCLAEGVDVPAIDSVAFTHPRTSISQIVQAIGRALRRDPEGTGVATVVVPILLPDDAEEIGDTDLKDYRTLWQVVRALRAHDAVFGAAIDRAEYPAKNTGRPTYEERPLDHVLIELPEGYDDGAVLEHLTARIIASSRSRWWDGYIALKAFHSTRGTTNVPRDHVTDDDVRLGAWVDATRTAYRQGRLAVDRMAALRELNFDFLPRALEWETGIRAATAFHAEHGHLEPVSSLRVLDVDLLAWLDKQRARATDGQLDGLRRAALDALGMRWTPRLDTFADYLVALTEHHRRHGNIDITPDPDTDDGRLGAWLVRTRMKRKRRELTESQIAALDRLGMQWSSPAARSLAAASLS